MGRKVTTRRRQNVVMGSRMFSFVTLVMGYLLASVFDINQLSAWISKNLLTQTNPVKTAQLQSTALPKPKFEFYTLLTKEQSSIPSATPTHPAPTVVAKPSLPPTVESNLPSANAVSKPVSAPIDLTVTQKLPLHAPFVVSAAQQPKVMPTPKPVAGGKYTIQVASFRNSREAEKMRTVLTSRGFPTLITSMTQQRVTWYRVLIGPFDSITDAQRVHRDFAQRQGINGMIRRLQT